MKNLVIGIIIGAVVVGLGFYFLEGTADDASLEANVSASQEVVTDEVMTDESNNSEVSTEEGTEMEEEETEEVTE